MRNRNWIKADVKYDFLSECGWKYCTSRVVFKPHLLNILLTQSLTEATDLRGTPPSLKSTCVTCD